MKLLTSDIVEIEEAQCRHGINNDAVNRYADHLQEGGNLPNIKVAYDKATGRYILFDGSHTLRAHKKLQLKHIEADVEEGDEDDAVWWAVAQNKAHGLPRNVADREKAILQALSHPRSKDMTEEDLANYVGTSRREIFRVRQKIEQPKTDRTRDHEYEGALKIIREDNPTLADNLSVGIVSMPKEEVIRLAGKDDAERKALVPVMADRRLTLKQAEQLVKYIPKDESLPMKTFIDFHERNPTHDEFYFRSHKVLVSITILP